MPKIKSPIEKLKEKGIVGIPVKLDPDWYKKHLEAEQKAKEEARKKEEDRIKKIKCPSCKSTSKDHIEKRNDNGIIGPGYSSWVIEEYYVCKKCGTMFKDMEKMKNKQKTNRFFDR
jgi:protein-arginine kinase activator protein McsA